jgi:hypothetical protein
MENNNNESNQSSALARQVQNNLEKAEKEFHALKEKYFGDKINELEGEIEALNNGTHQGRKLFLKDINNPNINANNFLQ